MKKNLLTVCVFVLFLFVMTSPVQAESVAGERLETGIYYIHPGNAPEKVIDIYQGEMEDGGYAILYHKNIPQSENQLFAVIDMKSYYVIFACHSEKCLDVCGGNQVDVTNIIQYAYHNGDNQKWILKDTGDGYYIVSAYYDENMCWDIYEVSDQDGTPLTICPYNGGPNQKYLFEKVDDIQMAPTLEDMKSSEVNQSYVRKIAKTEYKTKFKLRNCKHTTNSRLYIMVDNSATTHILVLHICNKCGEMIDYVDQIIPTN